MPRNIGSGSVRGERPGWCHPERSEGSRLLRLPTSCVYSRLRLSVQVKVGENRIKLCVIPHWLGSRIGATLHDRHQPQ
jgi:hypothetical protein